MPFDPSEPKSGTPKRSKPIRDNFVALKALIDALPAGQQGPPGADGNGIANIRFNPDNTITIEMTNGATFGPFPLPAGPAGPAGADSTVPGPAGNDGRGIAEVYDSGDGRAMVRLSDGVTYGPFSVANGPAGAQGERGSDGSPGQPGERGSDGSQGPAGNDGRSVANVRDSGDGRAIIDMSDGTSYGPFIVASGPVGAQGQPGNDGSPGQPGERGSDGAQGPAGNDGRSVSNVRDSGDGRAIVDMNDGTSYGPFYVASGPVGPQGNTGNDGRGISEIRNNGDNTLTVVFTDGNTAGPFPLPAGPAGPQGPQGEVSAADLNFAFGATSANSNGVQKLNLSVSWPPAQNEMQMIADKLDELIQALRR